MNNLKTKKMSHLRTKMSLLLLVVFSLLSVANAQSILGGNPKLLPSDQVNSDQFKLKVGQNRVQEFKLLNNLIKSVPLINEPAPNYEYFIGDYTTSLSELIYLLGEPDVKVSSTIYQYNLGVGSSNSKAYIGINNEGFVTYSVINLNN